MSENPLFNVGDSVQRKSGGPVMRVIARFSGFGIAAGVNNYSCQWHDEEGIEQEGEFLENELDLVSRRRAE
jgi:uncharacterized protein YodC (DUF2158 family)